MPCCPSVFRRRSRSSLGALLCVGLVWLVCSCRGTFGGVPREIEQLFFERGRFAESIGFPVGPGDSPAYYDRALNSANDKDLIPLVIITNYGRWSLKVLNFLVRKGFTRVGHVRQVNRYHSGDYYFILHSARVDSLGSIAHRKLNRMTYTHRYKGTYGESTTEFYAATFTYSIVTDRLDMPIIDKGFEGKAKAVLDPGTGHWTLVDMNLSDAREREFELCLEKSEPAFDPVLSSF